MKSKLLLAILIIAGILVVEVILENNTSRKYVPTEDDSLTVQSTGEKLSSKGKTEPLNCWQVEGMRYAFVFSPNQATVDYINSVKEDSLDIVYIFGADGRGSAVSNDRKKELFKFDYNITGLLLTINNGQKTQYFQKFNEKTFIRVSDSELLNGSIKIRKLE